MNNDILLYWLKNFLYWMVDKLEDMCIWISNHTSLFITIVWLLVGATVGYLIYIPAMGLSIIGIMIVIYLVLVLLYLTVAAILVAADSDTDLIELWFD